MDVVSDDEEAAGPSHVHNSLRASQVRLLFSSLCEYDALKHTIFPDFLDTGAAVTK
jgi:hypothetical protein